MAIEIISKRERKFDEAFELFFERPEEKGMGYAFPCDSFGHIDFQSLEPAARENYFRAVKQGLPRTVRHLKWSYVVPAVGRCDCGELVQLDLAHNECEHCHRWYNSFGQRLVHPSLWGEETGETAADIL